MRRLARWFADTYMRGSFQRFTPRHIAKFLLIPAPGLVFIYFATEANDYDLATWLVALGSGFIVVPLIIGMVDKHYQLIEENQYLYRRLAELANESAEFNTRLKRGIAELQAKLDDVR